MYVNTHVSSWIFSKFFFHPSHNGSTLLRAIVGIKFRYCKGWWKFLTDLAVSELSFRCLNWKMNFSSVTLVWRWLGGVNNMTTILSTKWNWKRITSLNLDLIFKLFEACFFTQHCTVDGTTCLQSCSYVHCACFCPLIWLWLAHTSPRRDNSLYVPVFELSCSLLANVCCLTNLKI